MTNESSEIKYKQRSVGWSTFLSTLAVKGATPPLHLFPFQRELCAEQFRKMELINNVQDIVHRWWVSRHYNPNRCLTQAEIDRL